LLPFQTIQILKRKLKKQDVCGLDSTGYGHGLMTGCREHGDEFSGSIKV